LILGDSMPFGYHVGFEETFGPVLDRQLGRSVKDVEVRVAAISGWDTRTELKFLRAEGMQLEPDIVVLCLFINDFMSILPLDGSPGTSGERVNTRPRWSRWMSEDAALWLKQSALIFFVRSRFEWAIASLYDRLLEPNHDGIGVESRLMANANDVGTRAAMEMMQSLIGKIDEVARRNGAEFAIALMPNYEMFAREPDSLNFVGAIRSFARERGIAFIDPTADFRSYGRVDDLYLRPWDNAHFSVLGHRLVAAKLLEELEPRFRNGEGSGGLEPTLSHTAGAHP
jgi:lysophospholipase L1-like esterase